MDEPDSIVLAPRFEDTIEPFTGGWIRASDDSGNADHILFARFSFFDSGHWQVIDDDYGFQLHENIHAGSWAVFWDVSSMAGGLYDLRLELFPLDGDLREEEREHTNKNGTKIKRKLDRSQAERLAFSEAWADFSSAWISRTSRTAASQMATRSTATRSKEAFSSFCGIFTTELRIHRLPRMPSK
jgi:hypothetical protein